MSRPRAARYTAIKAAGREKDVTIVAVDGGCTGVQAVKDGEIAATSQQYPLKMAQLGVEAVVKYAQGGGKPSGYTDTGCTLITDKPQQGVDSKDTTFGLATAGDRRRKRTLNPAWGRPRAVPRRTFTQGPGNDERLNCRAAGTSHRGGNPGSTYLRRYSLSSLGPFVALLLAGAYFTTQTYRFLSASNFSLIVQQSMVVGVLAMGQTIIILTAGIDLSSGAVMALGSIVMTRQAVYDGVNPYLAIVLGVGTCILAWPTAC